MTCVLPAVRFVQADSLLTQLELGHVVLLSSLAYSAAGEVLNCNSYDVAVHAAVDLKADKFICVLDGVSDMGLPQWLPLRDAEELIGQRAAALQQVRGLCGGLQVL
jgi:amino-acid N-acetyltransferase